MLLQQCKHNYYHNAYCIQLWILFKHICYHQSGFKPSKPTPMRRPMYYKKPTCR